MKVRKEALLKKIRTDMDNIRIAADRVQKRAETELARIDDHSDVAVMNLRGDINRLADLYAKMQFNMGAFCEAPFED